MAGKQPALTLAVPGLLGPTAARAPEFARFRPRLTALDEWLGRGSVRRIRHNSPDHRRFALETELAALFGLHPADPNEIPVAAISRLGEGDMAADARGDYWLRADPVHLRADQDRLVLFGAETLGLSLEESRRIIRELQALFREQNWQLEVTHAERWYLRLTEAPEIVAQGLPLAAGRHIDRYLPHGPESGDWHRWLTEIQMLLYGSQVNLERESRGALPVNSVWFWGGGALPRTLEAPWGQAYGDSPLLAGFAELSGTPHQPLPGHPEELHGSEGPILVSIDRLRDTAFYGDVAEWSERAGEVDTNWLQPALAALRGGRFRHIDLLPGNAHVYRLTRAGRWRFWRRGDLDHQRTRGEWASDE